MSAYWESRSFVFVFFPSKGALIHRYQYQKTSVPEVTVRGRAMSGKDQVSSDSVGPSLGPVPMSAAAFSSLKAQSLGSESTHPSAICTQISVPYQGDDHGHQEPALAIACPPPRHARGIPSFGLVHGFGRHPVHVSLCSPLKREGVFTSQTQNFTHRGDTKTSRHSRSRGTWGQELSEHRPADF